MSGMADLKLSASLEDYLEAILDIIREKQAVRAKDIGQRLGVGRSSVTGALHALADRKLINYAPYGVITLTESGEEIAKQVSKRHAVLHDFFVKVLGVDEAEADENACRMEHAISDDVMERFVKFVEFFEQCPHGGQDWLEDSNTKCKGRKPKKK